MENLKTFGEISNHIISKIELENDNGCTSQQAFYKLRNAITKVTGIPSSEISPSTELTSLFPKERRKIFTLIERELSLDLKAFRVPNIIALFIFTVFIASFIMIFINWKFGLFGIIFSIALTKFIGMTTTKFSEKTVGELAKSMMYDNYVEVRRNPNRVNRSEIKKNLEEMFIKELGLRNEFNELPDETIMVN
ncbi:hypothetical protein [Flavobacterium sp.]|uniref:hypothetical protein n=1 Tax=Flavobacterium sp. TaxID=239 RepID=UPI0039E4DEF1